MGKPKILIDVYYLHVAQTGIKTYIKTLCEEIEKNSQNSAFEYHISPDPKSVLNNNFFKGKTPKWKNLFFQLLYFFRKQFVLPFLSVIHRADIVFSPDIMSPWWARGKKVSVIHDTFFWDSPEHYQSLWLKYYLFFLKLGLKRNAEIITITEFSKTQIQKIPPFGNIPIHVVHPGTHFKALDSKKTINPLGVLFFLHVGVMEKRKNLGLLIDAFALLQEEVAFHDFKLVLVGQRGPRETLDDYDSLVKKVKALDIEEKIIFTGYLEEEMLHAYYSHALAYVFPSSNEGFGLPVLEAFSFGLPVIISPQEALMEVAADAAMVMQGHSSEALTDCMKKIFFDEKLREELKERGERRLKEFSAEKFFLSLEHTFEKILHG